MHSKVNPIKVNAKTSLADILPKIDIPCIFRQTLMVCHEHGETGSSTVVQMVINHV